MRYQACLNDEPHWTVRYQACLNDKSHWTVRYQACLNDEPHWTVRYQACLNDKPHWTVRYQACLNDQPHWTVRYQACLILSVSYLPDLLQRHCLRIYCFTPAWSSSFLQPEQNFLNHHTFTFHTTNVFHCFSSVMIQFELVKHYFPN